MIDLIVQVLRSPKITTPTQLVVALVIARRCGDERGVCFAKQTTLASDSRLHQKTVAKTIAELEGLGLIRKEKGRTLEDGRRTTDHLYLTLDAVTLPPTGPDDEDGSRRLPPGSPPLPGKESTTPQPGSPRLHKKGPIEETNEGQDAREGALSLEEEFPGVSIPDAVHLIWQAAGDHGRKRSRKDKVEKALVAALRRRPKGQAAEDRLRHVMLGYRAYLSDPDTRKEGGKFEKGIHRVLEGDVWEVYLAENGAPADEGQLDPDLGTTLEPGPRLQRFWAELAQQGMPWDPARGPRPGMPGCRISPEIQRQFGFTPWAPDPAGDDDDDGAAFA